jgi:hypothetical protein
MAGTAQNAEKILGILYSAERGAQIDGATLRGESKLSPAEINDAVARLVSGGFAEWIRTFGTQPYDFRLVSITPYGRVRYEQEYPDATSEVAATSRGGSPRQREAHPREISLAVSLPPQPMGSPYGFEDEDWEIVAERKGARDRLNVVLGHQFESSYYSRSDLRDNVEVMFQEAVRAYNEQPGALKTTLVFRALSAGYGEHLFNEIARDIISADIAAFDTSDLNPNVMLEIGVALTWGVRVLLIKEETCQPPPSDVSGQTYVDYRDSARTFVDPGHKEKLMRMVERAIRKKAPL